jgi:hypothetical protein
VANLVPGQPDSWHLERRGSERTGFAEIADEVRQALDVGVLSRHLGQWECPEVFDTLKLARRFLPGQRGYRLGALAEVLGLAEGLPEGLTPHRVAYDVLVAARLFVGSSNLPSS